MVDLTNQIEIVVRSFGKKYRLQKCDTDDMRQEIWLHCLTIHDKRLKNAKFASVVICHAAYSWLRGYVRQYKRQDGCDPMELLATAPAPPPSDCEPSPMADAISRLEPGQQLMVRLYFGIGYDAIPSVNRISTTLSVPRREVKRLLDSGLAALRASCELP